MIKLNVAAIKKRLVGEMPFQFELEPSELDLEPEDLPIIGKITVEGIIANAGEVLLLSARQEALVQRQCSRCLKEFEETTVAEVEEKFYPADTEALEKDAYTYDLDVLDITEVLREGLLLVEPISALCKEDCKGLCPVCGKDRNKETCDCDTRTIDPRLIAFKNLAKKLD